MALARESSGTVTADGTEQTLAAPTTPKTRVILVNLVNLVAGDTVEIRIKSKVVAAGAEILARFSGGIKGPVTEVRFESPPVATVDGATFTLKQTTGTNRSYEWSVLTLD